MVSRNVIMFHILDSDVYEFYGSPASLYDKHDAKEILISQKSLNNHFSKQQLSGKAREYGITKFQTKLKTRE